MSKQSIPESGIYDARELGVPKMLILGFQHKIGRASCRERV